MEIAMHDEVVHELLYQALETELGGVQIYEAALRCVQNDELREEWEKYHVQTQHHVELARGVVEAFGLDAGVRTPGRDVVHHIGASLVEAMDKALAAGDPNSAELVAAECVTLAETKNHLNWELLSEVVGRSKGEAKAALAAALEEIEEQEDEHLYHSTGWARELWLQALGVPAVLPPPEERKDVKTAIGAARAKHGRDKLAGHTSSR